MPVNNNINPVVNQPYTDACLWNARSLVNKLNDFSSFVYTLNYQIIAITETWLTSSIYNNEILPTQYTIYRSDRNSRGGGIMIAINQSIPSKIISISKEVEALTVQLLLEQPINLCLIYNPPNSESNYQQKLLAYLSDNMQATEEVILLGDFNVPDINWATLSGSSDLSSKLCDLIFQHNYVQQVDHPTHIHGNILDLIITSSEDTVSGINITKEFNQAIKLDHYLISFKLQLTSLSPTTSKDPVYIFDYHKGDYESLNDLLYNTDFPLVINQVMWNLFGHILSLPYAML